VDERVYEYIAIRDEDIKNRAIESPAKDLTLALRLLAQLRAVHIVFFVFCFLVEVHTSFGINFGFVFVIYVFDK
jgi:F0F1-type ATP synthase membrane subunit a